MHARKFSPSLSWLIMKNVISVRQMSYGAKTFVVELSSLSLTLTFFNFDKKLKYEFQIFSLSVDLTCTGAQLYKPMLHGRLCRSQSEQCENKINCRTDCVPVWTPIPVRAYTRWEGYDHHDNYHVATYVLHYK